MDQQKSKSKELERSVDDYDTTGMDSRWFNEDANEEEKAKTKETLLNSRLQFRRLKYILQSEFRSKLLTPTDFDKPNFDQRRIYHEGYLKALQTIYKLLP